MADRWSNFNPDFRDEHEILMIYLFILMCPQKYKHLCIYFLEHFQAVGRTVALSSYRLLRNTHVV